LIVVQEGLSVGNFKNDFGLGKSVGKIESGVTAILESLAEEGVKLSLEEAVMNMLSKSVLDLVNGHHKIIY
jgi:hypothetical protein